MADLLDRIDATVDGLCACGCGQQLDPSGPSGWWASETCQTRWQRRRVRPDDARLADDAPCPQCVGRCEPGCGCTCWGITTEEASEAFVEFDRRLREAIEAQEGERAVLAGEPDSRARGLPWRLSPPAGVEAPTAAELEGGAGRPGDAIRGLGEAAQRVTAAFAGFGESFRQMAAAGVQAEQDRVALRALCSDDAEYERALEAARDNGLTVREVSEMLAAGSCLVDGQWLESHVCAWDLVYIGRYRCCLRWADGTRCDSITIDPSALRRTERMVGPSATGGGS